MPASLQNADNEMIQALPARERKRLLAACELRQLGADRLAGDRGAALVLFPATCLLAVVTSGSATPPLALMLEGRRGMVGASLCLGNGPRPFAMRVLLPGSAWGLGPAAFLRQLRASPALLRATERHHLLQQRRLVATAGCAHFHHLEGRLALWLLRVADEAGPRFTATHDQLARLLGVQRAAVSLAAGALKARGALDYRRGVVRVLRRDLLERSACRCLGHWPAPA